MIKYDGTVRDSSGNIIEFLYGDDGMSGEYIEGFICEFIEMSDANLIKEFRFFDPNDERDISE